MIRDGRGYWCWSREETGAGTGEGPAEGRQEEFITLPTGHRLQTVAQTVRAEGKTDFTLSAISQSSQHYQCRVMHLVRENLLLTKYIYGKSYIYREHAGWKEVSHAGSEGGLAKPPCEVLSFCR